MCSEHGTSEYAIVFAYDVDTGSNLFFVIYFNPIYWLCIQKTSVPNSISFIILYLVTILTAYKILDNFLQQQLK